MKKAQIKARVRGCQEHQNRERLEWFFPDTEEDYG